MMSDEGDNRRGRQSQSRCLQKCLRIDGNDVCALATVTTTQPVVMRRCVERRRRHVARQRRLEDESRWRRDKWGVASCDNQMAKKRSRQSRKAESAAARQQGRHDNQLAKKRRMGGEAYKRQKEGEASADKRQRSAERTRGGGGTT
jgi:hypothetical protein